MRRAHVKRVAHTLWAVRLARMEGEGHAELSGAGKHRYEVRRGKERLGTRQVCGHYLVAQVFPGKLYRLEVGGKVVGPTHAAQDEPRFEVGPSQALERGLDHLALREPALAERLRGKAQLGVGVPELLERVLQKADVTSHLLVRLDEREREHELVQVLVEILAAVTHGEAVEDLRIRERIKRRTAQLRQTTGRRHTDRAIAVQVQVDEPPTQALYA